MKFNTVPKNWVSVSLDDICDIEMGQSPPSNTYNNHGDGLPFFQGKAEFNDLYPTVKKWCTRPNKIVDKNTILISVRAPVGPTNIAPARCCIGRGLAGLKPYSGVSNRFVLYGLRALEIQLSSMGAGSTFDAIASSDLRNFKMPLAPVNEQARILQKIEEQISRLDFAISGLNRIKTNLKRYRASVLQAAVEGRLTAEWRKDNLPSETGAELLVRLLKERRAKWEENQLKKYAQQGKTPPKDWKEKYPEPVKPDTTGLPELPEGWAYCAGQQICELITKGTTPAASKLLNGEGNVRFLKVYNLTTSGALNYNIKPTFIDREVHFGELNRSIVRTGDVLINIVGPPLGQVSMVPKEISEANINQAIARYRPLPGLNNRFMMYALMAEKIMGWAIARAKTTVGQTNLTLEICRELPLPLPPNKEQDEVVQKISHQLSFADAAGITIESALKRAALLRQSILKRAFEGRLVPQDPNDEPASVLLERIRAKRAEQAATVKPARIKRKEKGHAS